MTLDHFTPGTTWRCNGNPYALTATHATLNSDDRLEVDLRFEPTYSRPEPLPTFDGWTRERTIRIHGQAWDVMAWQRQLDLGGTSWQFTLARCPLRDTPAPPGRRLGRAIGLLRTARHNWAEAAR